MGASGGNIACFVLASLLVGCGANTAPDPRYPARPKGCGLRSYEEAPPYAVDDLGVVEVDCANESRCGRKLADEVCLRGGDVVWGLGENKQWTGKKSGHAAHTSHNTWGPRAEGCEVAVSGDAPPVRSENVGAVTARCVLEDSDEVCLRVLKNAVCKLGGDILWGVGRPVVKDNKKVIAGRAAHTK